MGDSSALDRPRRLDPASGSVDSPSMMMLLFVVLAALVSTAPPSNSKAIDDGIFITTDEGMAIDGQVVHAETPPQRLRLAILPDRTTGRDWGLPYLEAAVADLQRLRPDAIFCVGDLIQGYTRNPREWDRQADEYLEIVDALPSTFFPVPGNHDVISGSRDPSDRTFVDRYRTRFGPVHYAVAFEEGTVIVLFSDEALDDRNVSFSNKQLNWLEGVLGAAPTDRPIVLLMHRPLWRYAKVKWDDRVHPLLVKHGVNAVIAGHFHALHREPDRDSIEYHLLGVCGGSIDQHPLTGQFHHLTMLDLGPGDSISIMHMPVGVTMPDDIVVRIDQDRAFKMKRAYSNVAVDGILPDPRRGAFDTSISLRLKNPTDVALMCSVAPATRVDSWAMTSLPFTTATPRDTRNESTTAFETPFVFDLPSEPVHLEPGEGATLKIGVTSPRTETSPQPPQLLITATFTDSRGRDVPIVIHRRVPIERSMQAGTAETFSISAWRHSVYELPERDSMATVDLSHASPSIRLTLEDDLLCFDGNDIVATKRNPTSDLIRILIEGNTPTPREFLLAPADPEGRLIDVASGEVTSDAWTIVRTDGGPASVLITLEGVASATMTGIQIEVADNDETFHTQWRRLAPKGTFLTITP